MHWNGLQGRALDRCSCAKPAWPKTAFKRPGDAILARLEASEG